MAAPDVPDPRRILAAGYRDIWRLAAELPPTPSPADLAGLRAAAAPVSPEVVGQILTQTALRKRARRTFGATADSLLFTETGLQQSTHPVVAGRRAARLAATACRDVVDLGCGIGIDSLAFARAGLDVTSVEIDPATAAVASHNLAGAGRVVVGDATTHRVEATSGVFLDPARRAVAGDATRRIHDPNRWQPNWTWVVGFAAAHPRTIIKSAPGLPHEVIPPGVATEWVSLDGTLVETALWGPEVGQGAPRRRAVLLSSGGADVWTAAAERVLASDDPRREAETGPLGGWIVEPDPAVIRSGLVAELCDTLSGTLLSTGIAYVTVASDPGATLGRRMAVLDVLPARVKPLRAELRRRGVRGVTIRTRGLDLDPERLRAQLALSGDGESAELVLTRVAGKATALLVASVRDQP